MGRMHAARYKCDVCGKEAEAPAGVGLPEGWSEEEVRDNGEASQWPTFCCQEHRALWEEEYCTRWELHRLQEKHDKAVGCIRYARAMHQRDLEISLRRVRNTCQQAEADAEAKRHRQPVATIHNLDLHGALEAVDEGDMETVKDILVAVYTIFESREGRAYFRSVWGNPVKVWL